MSALATAALFPDHTAVTQHRFLAQKPEPDRRADHRGRAAHKALLPVFTGTRRIDEQDAYRLCGDRALASRTRAATWASLRKPSNPQGRYGLRKPKTKWLQAGLGIATTTAKDTSR